MSRRRAVLWFASLVALVSLAGGCGSEVPVATEVLAPWNLIFVTLDTTRADAFGVYGQPRPTTPNIDSMAVSGVLFERCFTASPSTLPSHSTLFTGLYPYGHGARSNSGYVLSEEAVTLAEVLSRHGYATHAEVAASVIAARAGLAQGFDVFRDPDSVESHRKVVRVEEGQGEFREVDLEERDAADISRAALAFLESPPPEPFFLWLHYFDPHSFYSPPESFLARFPDSAYHSEVHYVDYHFGRVLSALRTRGFRERTLVVLTADHGEGLGEHGEATHSFFVYDTTLRVPLIFWGPEAIGRGRRVTGLAQTVDVMPTVLDWLGVPMDKPGHGQSLRPWMLGGTPASQTPRPIYAESAEPLMMFGSSMLRSLRVGRWKYIHKLEPELYDLEEDPDELENRYARHPERSAKMRAQLEAMVAAAPSLEAARTSVDDQDWERLNALGYVGGEAPADFSDAEDVRVLRGPDPLQARLMLDRYATAWAAAKAGRFEMAAREFRELHQRYPESVPVLRGLLAALSGLEAADELLAGLEKAVRLAPEDMGFRTRLASVLAKVGRAPEGEALLRAAYREDPCRKRVTAMLAQVLNQAGRIQEQRDLLANAAAACPGEIAFRNDYAYLLATSGDDGIRNPRLASRIAKQVVKESGGRRPEYLDTLACAQAARGHFKPAAKSERRALELLRQRPDIPSEQRAVFLDHLARFEAGEAISLPGDS